MSEKIKKLLFIHKLARTYKKFKNENEKAFKNIYDFLENLVDEWWPNL